MNGYPEPIFNDSNFNPYNSKELFSFQNCVNRKEMIEAAIKKNQFCIDDMEKTNVSVFLTSTCDEAIESCKKENEYLINVLATL